MMKIVDQEVLGYSHNPSRTHFKHIIEQANGEVIVRYSTHEQSVDGTTILGEFREFLPHIEVPVE